MAAQVGVPAHVTVAYPFKPVELLTRDDIEALTLLFHRFQPVVVTFLSTAWFGDDVLYLKPSDPAPLTALTTAVEDSFPQYPTYGGAYEVVHPHLTVGHFGPRDALGAAEREVLKFLPVQQLVSHVELWRGPSPAKGMGRWTRVRSFQLGRTPGTRAPAP